MIDPVTLVPVLQFLFERYTSPKGAVASKGAAAKEKAVEEERPERKPVVGNYVTRLEGFERSIIDLRDVIQTYSNREKPARPLNVLLAAPPGSGKSFLIKQLLKSLEIDAEKKSFEEIYIASLEATSELYGIFQRVQSLNLEGKLPFVFFDEIDTPISGETTFAKFLAPMWDGNFYIGKEKFYLGKSLFFFAGSGLSAEEKSKEILDNSTSEMNYETYYREWLKVFKTEIKQRKDKVEDFIDRLDFILRIPPSHKTLLGVEQVGLELEDIAISLIKKHFPKVRTIDKRALACLTTLLAEHLSRRSAEIAVFSAKVRDNVFEFDDLPRRQKEEMREYSKNKEPLRTLFEDGAKQYFKLIANNAQATSSNDRK
jgi:hypothetical protein